MNAEAYADAVIGALAGDFPDLNDPVIAEIVHRHVCAHVQHPGRLEVIVDDPFRARWRLTGNRDQPGRVRLGCWYQKPSSKDEERLARLNTALDALDVEVQR